MFHKPRQHANSNVLVLVLDGRSNNTTASSAGLQAREQETRKAEKEMKR